MYATKFSRLWGVGLCLFALALGGCQGRTYPPGSPLDPNYRPPPSNASQAAALSGGKITRFVPAADANPANPSDRALLKGCRQLTVSSHVARGAYYVIAYRTEKIPVPVLVVGQQILVSPNDIIRGMCLTISIGRRGYSWHLKGKQVTMASEGTLIIYSDDRRFPQQYIMLTPGSKFADVGGIQVRLQQPVVWVNDEKGQVMLLSDWLRVFKASDAQTGGQSIRQVGIIYKLPPYGHF